MYFFLSEWTSFICLDLTSQSKGNSVSFLGGYTLHSTTDFTQYHSFCSSTETQFSSFWPSIKVFILVMTPSCSLSKPLTLALI